ncbi:hypothetical protein SFUMM280S_04702 [Streptomyces fumanus]
MTSLCDGPCGAVSPLLAPLWFSAEPRITASTGCPRRRASDSRSTTSTPAPSPQPTPSASAEKDLQRPSEEIPPRLSNATGNAITVTPPTSAEEHSSRSSAWQARCRATPEDEQPVSTASVGPRSPNV